MTKPYRPSNGTEGMWFMSQFCERCHYDQKYQRTQDGKYGCKIIMLTHVYNIDDPEYPKEWVQDEAGNPTCTKFKLPTKRVRGAVKKHRRIKGQMDLV